jgi:hypothetical protein
MDAQVFYRMTGPTGWPSPPAYYSYSSLSVLQECPRRWQLIQGQYGDLNRLPEAPSEAAEVGHLVHEVLSRLMVALAQRGLPSLGSKGFQEAMKSIDLRGLVQRQIDTVHGKIEGHPRAAAVHWHLTLGDVLNRVLHQFHLTYPLVQAGKTIKIPPSTPSKGSKIENKDLASKLTVKGLLSEEEVRHATMRLRGFIDLIHATQTGPVILDFKTGAQHDEHRNQLELYALLWWSSTGQIPSALVLRYADREDRWTIDEATLLQMESTYKNLLDKFDAALSKKPADAHPGPHCRRCPGRPFCDPYWTTGPAGVDPLSAAEGTWLDVEGKLLAVGEGAAQVLIQGNQVTLTLQEPTLLRAAVGSTLRLLGVRRGPSESLQLGERSEVFFRDALPAS